MGTWSTGPLDSDNALDFLHELATEPTPADREKLLLTHLEDLAAYDPAHTTAHHTGDLATANAVGVAACTAVVMKLSEQAGLYPYMWGNSPGPDEPGDFRTEMLLPVSPRLLHAAQRAIAVARALVGHPDMPEWNTDEAAVQHAGELDNLANLLHAAGLTPPPIPADGDAPVPVRVTTPAQLAEVTGRIGAPGDWHEPDQAGITATVHGTCLDTSGAWPVEEAKGRGKPPQGGWPLEGLPAAAAQPTPPGTEMYLTLHKAGQPVAYVNLALLLAWAGGWDGPRE